MRLIHTPETLIQATAVQAWLAEHSEDYAVTLDVQSETPTARELRKQPELCLIYDADGLWLASNGMKMQPDWAGQLVRLYRAGIRNELLARACMAMPNPTIVDATAGLGHDALLLAWLGASVILLERNPLLAILLVTAKEQALRHTDARLQQAVARMTLIHTQSEDYLASRAQAGLPMSADPVIDVVYLDPMFPKNASDKKQPLVKKEMQILQGLLHGNSSEGIDTGDALLPLAMNIAKRVIVKRPKLAEPLAGIAPANRWVGDACRFDGYFQHAALDESVRSSDA